MSMDYLNHIFQFTGSQPCELAKAEGAAAINTFSGDTGM